MKSCSRNKLSIRYDDSVINIYLTHLAIKNVMYTESECYIIQIDEHMK